MFSHKKCTTGIIFICIAQIRSVSFYYTCPGGETTIPHKQILEEGSNQPTIALKIVCLQFSFYLPRSAHRAKRSARAQRQITKQTHTWWGILC
jgi:PDZ domain-containing secreted protein